MNQKDLDALLYDWVSEMLTETSGYPSETQEFKIMKNGIRVQGGITYAPIFKSKPIIKAIDNYIRGLSLRRKNCLVGKYLESMTIREIATYNECSFSSVHRDIRAARKELLEKLTLFNHNNSKI